MTRAEEFLKLIRESESSRIWALWERHRGGEKINALAWGSGMSSAFLGRAFAKMKCWQAKLDRWRRDDAVAEMFGMVPSKLRLSLP